MSKKHTQNHTKKYYVQGMHCSTCEILISQDISNLKGVKKTQVSLSKSSVVVQAESKQNLPSHDSLNNLFKDLGYTFHNEKPKEQNITADDFVRLVGVAVMFVFAFYTIEKSGFFMKYSLSAQSSLGAYFVFGLAAGISSCAALIGGLLLALSKNWNAAYANNSKKSATPFIYFNISRIVAFGLLGGLLGYFGSFLQVSVELTAVLTLVVGLIMLVLGLQMIGVKWFNRFSFNLIKDNKFLNKNSEVQGKYVPLIVGALTFFIPCGFTLIAQTNVLTSGSFYRGMLQLTAFALGTLPMLALISFSSVKFYSNPKFSKKFSLFSGVVIAFFALYTINSQLNVLGFVSLSDVSLSSSNSVPTATMLDKKSGYQLLQMEARGFEYYPKEITLQSGVKTQWTITNNGSRGCASAVYARGLYPDVIYLKPGVNTVEFVAPQPGTYKISCSMGMVAPVTVRVY